MVSKRKRHSVAEVAAKLRQADLLAKEGKLQSDIARALGVSIMTYHRWRKSMRPRSTGGPSVAASPDRELSNRHRAEDISDLRVENARLRQLITDLLLEKMKLEEKLTDQHRSSGAPRRAS
jgi:putative transposase